MKLPLLLLLAHSALADDRVATLLQDVATQTHECQPIIIELDGVLQKDPEDLAARLARATCLYRVGRMSWALEDTTLLLSDSAKTPLDKALGKRLGKEPAAASAADGFALHVVLLTLAGRLEEARTWLNRARSAYGERPSIRHAGAILTWKSGQHDAAWAAVDRLLADAPGDPAAVLAAQELVSLDPDHASEAALRVVEEPTRVASAYNSAISALNAQDGDRCLAALDKIRGEVSGLDLSLVTDLSYPCAVVSGDVTRADAALAELAAPPADRLSTVLLHAELRYRAGAYAETVALLDQMHFEHPEDSAMAATLKTRVHLAMGDLDAALADTKSGDVRPTSRANLALALKQAGRIADAKALLEETCPVMIGQDAAQCYELLGRLNSG